MLENISLIASIICGLTAITTALRAVGTAREYSCNKAASNRKTGGDTSATPPTQRSSLKLHLIVTVIWFTLSLIFMAPVAMQKWSSNDTTWISLIILSYLALIIIVALIWRKVKRV